MCYEILRVDRYERAIGHANRLWAKTCYERFDFQRYLWFAVRIHLTVLSSSFTEIGSNKRMLSSVNTFMSEYLPGDDAPSTSASVTHLRTGVQKLAGVNK